MDSTLKVRVAEPHDDPHDAPAIAPDVVPAAWADKVLADITRDAKSPASGQQPLAESLAADTVSAPTVDTTFRPTAVGDIRIEGTRPPAGARWARRIFMALFALCSAIAAAAWQHYGDTATQIIANWVPPFALASPSSTEKTGLAEQPNPAPVLASAADQAASQPAAPVQPAESDAAAAAASSPESARLIQSMARDLAAMGQQIEQLKASIAELKANQQPMPPAVARTSEARTSEARPSEIRPAEVRTPVPNPPPKMSALPQPRPAMAPVRKPKPAYLPPQAAVAPLPLATPSVAPPQPAPPPQAASEPDGEPVVRPPLPLRP